MIRARHILVVLTSHDRLGDIGQKTGFWLEEFASPKAGQPPLDPKSDAPEGQTEMTRRFKKDLAVQDVLANTVVLSEVEAKPFDAAFYPGGHGRSGCSSPRSDRRPVNRQRQAGNRVQQW